MKAASIVFASIMALPLSSFAASTITCLDGHEAAANQKMQTVVKQEVVTLFKQKGIAFDPATIVLDFDVIVTDNSNVSPDSPTSYGQFVVKSGSFSSTAGTPFSVDYSGSYQDGKYGQYPAFYQPVLTSKGYDKEGNPIDPHCTLKHADYVGYANEAEWIEVTNSRSGKLIGKMNLPSSVSVY